MSSPEPSVSSAPETGATPGEHELTLLEASDSDGQAAASGGRTTSSNGGSTATKDGTRERSRPTPIVPLQAEPPDEAFDDTMYRDSGPPTTELEYDEEPMLSDLSDPLPLVPLGQPADDDDDDDFVEVVDRSSPTKGRMKARKVRRVVRYVSPWSVLKVSLLFYACLWVIATIASVILWRVAVETGTITNIEKFVARLFGETTFTIDGREILRASTVAGVILVFAGTGFTVLMSLLFNVICDITGGIRFTVLELESTRRRVKAKVSKR